MDMQDMLIITRNINHVITYETMNESMVFVSKISVTMWTPWYVLAWTSILERIIWFTMKTAQVVRINRQDKTIQPKIQPNKTINHRKNMIILVSISCFLFDGDKNIKCTRKSSYLTSRIKGVHVHTWRCVGEWMMHLSNKPGWGLFVWSYWYQLTFVISICYYGNTKVVQFTPASGSNDTARMPYSYHMYFHTHTLGGSSW